MAALLGVDVGRVISMTFVIGAALAAVAGVMVTLYYGVIDFYIGFAAGIKAFSAAVLGGIFLRYAWRIYRHYTDILARKTFTYSIIYLSLMLLIFKVAGNLTRNWRLSRVSTSTPTTAGTVASGYQERPLNAAPTPAAAARAGSRPS